MRYFMNKCAIMVALLVFLLVSCSSTGGNPNPQTKQEEEPDVISTDFYNYYKSIDGRILDSIITRTTIYHRTLLAIFSQQVRAPLTRTSIYILPNEGRYRESVKQSRDVIEGQTSALDVPTRTILTYPINDSKVFYRGLFQQQTRQFLYDVYRRNLPMWLEEGLVLFFEEATFKAGEECRYLITGDSADKMAALWVLLEHNPPSLQQVISTDNREEFTEEYKLISWGLVYWFYKSKCKGQNPYRNKAILWRYLTDIAKKGADVKLSDYTKTSTEKLEETFQDWIFRQEER